MDKDRMNSIIIAQEYKMRFYESEFPQEGELVMGQSQSSEENGCYVALLQYNSRVGMMPINEYTTYMRKNIHKATKTGKREILRVVRVDKEKGYIDLSKKQVNVDDEAEGLEKYSNSTQMHSILIHIAQACKVPILDLYERYIWPIYKEKKNDHPLNLLKQAYISEEKLEELNIDDENIKKSLLEELKRRYKRPIIKVMANFSVSCRAFYGINAIKKSLKAGISNAKDRGSDVKIFIIGAPKYTCQVSFLTIQAGKNTLFMVLSVIEKSIKEVKGEFSIDKQPYIIGDINQHIKNLIKNEEIQLVLDEEDEDMGDADD